MDGFGAVATVINNLNLPALTPALKWGRMVKLQEKFWRQHLALGSERFDFGANNGFLNESFCK